MYLDPGFGSMVIQLIIAGLASAGAFFWTFRNKLKKLFSKKKNTAVEQASNKNPIVNEDQLDNDEEWD